MVNSRALLIGLGEAGHKHFSTSDDNVEAMKALLATHADGSPNLYCRTLVAPPSPTAETALTTDKLKKELMDFFTPEGHLLVLYYCGHGETTVEGGCLVTQHNTPANPGVPFTYLVGLAEKALREGTAAEVVILMDCCYSGDVGNLPLFGAQRAYLPKGLSIITSSASQELSYFTKDSTVFTHHLLNGLRSGGADLLGHITVISLYSYVNKMLSTLQYQTPYLKTYSSSLHPLRKDRPRIELETLRRLPELFPDQKPHPLNPKYEDSIEGFDPDKVKLFKIMQDYNKVGLVAPDGAKHMYFAAINSTSCSLTAEGKFYWDLAQRGRL